jgi:hypothetical protein
MAPVLASKLSFVVWEGFGTMSLDSLRRHRHTSFRSRVVRSAYARLTSRCPRAHGTELALAGALSQLMTSALSFAWGRGLPDTHFRCTVASRPASAARLFWC